MKNFFLKGESKNGEQITIDFTNTKLDANGIRRAVERKGIKVISILEYIDTKKD